MQPLDLFNPPKGIFLSVQNGYLITEKRGFDSSLTALNKVIECFRNHPTGYSNASSDGITRFLDWTRKVSKDLAQSEWNVLKNMTNTLLIRNHFHDEISDDLFKWLLSCSDVSSADLVYLAQLIHSFEEVDRDILKAVVTSKVAKSNFLATMKFLSLHEKSSINQFCWKLKPDEIRAIFICEPFDPKIFARAMKHASIFIKESFSLSDRELIYNTFVSLEDTNVEQIVKIVKLLNLNYDGHQTQSLLKTLGSMDLSESNLWLSYVLDHLHPSSSIRRFALMFISNETLFQEMRGTLKAMSIQESRLLINYLESMPPFYGRAEKLLYVTILKYIEVEPIFLGKIVNLFLGWGINYRTLQEFLDRLSPELATQFISKIKEVEHGKLTVGSKILSSIMGAKSELLIPLIDQIDQILNLAYQRKDLDLLKILKFYQGVTRDPQNHALRQLLQFSKERSLEEIDELLITVQLYPADERVEIIDLNHILAASLKEDSLKRMNMISMLLYFPLFDRGIAVHAFLFSEIELNYLFFFPKDLLIQLNPKVVFPSEKKPENQKGLTLESILKNKKNRPIVKGALSSKKSMIDKNDFLRFSLTSYYNEILGLINGV